MWPFRRTAQAKGLVAPSNWKPSYYMENFAYPYPIAPGNSIREGGTKLPKGQPYKPLSWPTEVLEKCGHRALESLMGLFSLRDLGCPRHFWCQPEGVLLLAECYGGRYSDDIDNQNYIGVYLWAVREWDPVEDIGLGLTHNGEPVGGGTIESADAPFMKMLLFPMPDGAIRVIFGQVVATAAGGSFADQGVVDLDTAEIFYCASRMVGGLPELPNEMFPNGAPPQSYIIGCGQGQWRMAPCLQIAGSKWVSFGSYTELWAVTNEVHS